MQLDEALFYLKKQASTEADAFDSIASFDSSDGLSVFQGKVKETEISNSVGIGIRVFKNKCPGYAYTERLTKEAIDLMIKDAVSHTAFTKPLDIDLPSPENEIHETALYHPETENYSLDAMKTLCLDIESRVLKDKAIENVPYLGAGRSSSAFYLINSNGVFVSRKSSSLSAGAGAVACLNGVKKIGSYSQVVFDGNDFDAEKIASKTIEKAKALLGAKSISSGVYPVLFSEEVSASVFSMFSSIFSAETVQKGNSKLKGKLNQTIASPVVSILNAPNRKDLPGYTSFDGEGVLTYDFEIVQNGILKSFLYNLETASIDKVESTGSAIRSYSGAASCGFRNFVVPLGKQSTEDLFQSAPEMLYITKLEGSSGCSSVSGELSIGAQGFFVKNGSIAYPVEGLTLNTNFFDLLKNITAFGNVYRESYSAIQVPPFLVSEITVSN